MSAARRWMAITGFVVAASSVLAEVHIGGIQTHLKSHVSIEMIGYFENLPPAGYAPVRVMIDNRSQAARRWRFTFQSDSSYQLRQQSLYTWEASVEANRKSEFELAIPLAPVDSGQHSYPSLHVTVSGYGIENPNGYYATSHTYSGHPKSRFAGLSKELSVHSLGPLTEEAVLQSLELRSCSLDPDWLSPDWRTYIGFSTIWFSEGDWVQLNAAKRAGILQWVSQGGVLVYVAEQPSSSALQRAGLPGNGAGPASYGLGKVRAFGWDGQDLTSPEVVRHIQKWGAVAHGDNAADGYLSGWKLASTVPKADMNAPLIIFAIVVFALLVGPINLMVLAGKKRRHRLFITTPLISLGASVAMIGLILLQDGVGGEGSRVAMVHLVPEANQELIIQEQMSRTGVLLASGFTVPEDAHVSALTLKGDRRRARRVFRRGAMACTGDWFDNRAVQAHYLSQIRSSRARVELMSAAGDAPVLLSSVDGDLEDVFYIDAQGKYWRTDQLRVGEKATLRASNRREFKADWWSPNVLDKGIRAGGQIEELNNRAGYVYGRLVVPGDRLLDTLPTVDWAHQAVVVVGRCVDVAGGGE